jgi:nitroreductase
MEALAAIMNRKTTRRFSSEKISADKLTSILEAGLHAPSNDHMRKWEYVVIDDLEKRLLLIEKIAKERTTDEAIEIVDRVGYKDEEQRKMYIDAIPLQRKMLLTASALVLPFFYQRSELLKPKSLSDFNYFASVWCSIENILIAASSYNIQGVTRIPSEEERNHIKKVLNIHTEYELPCYIALGYPEEDNSVFKQVNIDITDHIHINSW